MEKYSAEAAQGQIENLLRRAAKGEEFLIMEDGKPLAKILPVSETDIYNYRMHSMRLKPIPDAETMSEEEYLKSLESLRGVVKRFDPTIESEDDRV